MAFGAPLYWRITHKQPRLMIFDGRLIALPLITIMHFRLWTVALTVIAFFVLWFFERKGVSPDSIIRFLRARLIGRRRTARGRHNERPAVDFAFETQAHVAMARRMGELRQAAAEKAKSKSSGKSKRKAATTAGGN